MILCLGILRTPEVRNWPSQPGVHQVEEALVNRFVFRVSACARQEKDMKPELKQEYLRILHRGH